VDSSAVSAADLQASQTVMVGVAGLLSAATTSSADFSVITTATNTVTVSVFMSKLSGFLVLVGSSLTSTEVATLGTELLTYKFSGAASSAVVGRIQFSLSTLQSFTVQLSAEIAGVQAGAGLAASSFSAVQLQQLVIVNTVYTEVITAMTTSMASTVSASAAATSATAFFSLCNKFFLYISSISIETLITNIVEVQTLQTELITASAAGVSQSSGQFLLIIQTIINSINIFISIIVQLTTGIATGSVTGSITITPAGQPTTDGTAQGGGTPVTVPEGGETPVSVPTGGETPVSVPDTVQQGPTMVMTTYRPITMTTARYSTGPMTGMVTGKPRPPLTTPDRRSARFMQVVWNRARGIRLF